VAILTSVIKYRNNFPRFRGVNRTKHVADHSSESNAVVECVDFYHHAPIRLNGDVPGHTGKFKLHILRFSEPWHGVVR
jgi:hypothetical protein